MPNPKTSEKSVYLDRDEHVSKGAIGAKQIVVYYYDSGTDELKPINSTNPLPVSATIDTTGLATSAKQDTIIGHVDGIETLIGSTNTKLDSVITNTDAALTDTELRATPVPVSGTVTATPTGTQDVQGNVASGASDSGNPVKIGGRYNSTQPTLTNGQRGDIQQDTRGNIKATLMVNDTGTTISAEADNADGVASSATTNNLSAMARNTVYNGTTWDRQLGNATDGTLVNLGANNDVTVTSGAITETNSAAIKTAVETIDNAISGSEMQVDVVGALPAGTNAIGKLSANSGVDIGDVDVTSTTFPTPVATSTYSPTRFVDFGSNATANIKSSAGNVFSLYCNNENSSDRYIQLHNTATTPAGGTTPLYSFRVPGSGDILVGTDFFTNAGANFTTGIAFAFSTTKDTYTAGTATEQSTTVHYK